MTTNLIEHAVRSIIYDLNDATASRPFARCGEVGQAPVADALSLDRRDVGEVVGSRGGCRASD